jgi:hypothetical protein
LRLVESIYTFMRLISRSMICVVFANLFDRLSFTQQS